jgi:hypothetical protein
MSIISYKNIEITKISCVNEEMLYNNESFYVKTPIIESSKVLNDVNGNFLYLKCYNTTNHNKFLNIIGAINAIFKFNIRNLSNIKIKIETLKDTFFNKNEENILPIEITDSSSCMCLLKYDYKIKEIVLFQYMKL